MNTYEKIQMNKDLPLKFEVVEVTKEKQKVIHKHWHRSIEIIMPIEGSIHIWDEGKIVNVTKNEAYIINSKNVHSLKGDGNEDYKGYMLQVKYDFLIKCFKDMDYIFFEQIKSKELNEKIYDLLKEIELHYEEEDEHKNVIIEGILMMIIHILLSHQKRIKNSGKIMDSDRDKKRILGITKYIEDHYSEDISVNMLAKKFNLSYGHFERFFKKNLNMTVKQYITNVRINKCRDELLNTDYAIVYIALENGFPNIQSFYKEFNKVFNITPARFRKISQINK